MQPNWREDRLSSSTSLQTLELFVCMTKIPRNGCLISKNSVEGVKVGQVALFRRSVSHSTPRIVFGVEVHRILKSPRPLSRQ